MSFDSFIFSQVFVVSVISMSFPRPFSTGESFPLPFLSFAISMPFFLTNYVCLDKLLSLIMFMSFDK